MTIRSPDAYYPPGEGPDPTATPAPVPVTPSPPAPTAPQLPTLHDIIADIDLDHSFAEHQVKHAYWLTGREVAWGRVVAAVLVVLAVLGWFLSLVF